MYSLPKNVYRERIDFSKIKTTVPIPNLIEIQKKSYERYLQMNRLPSEREDAGLQSVFKSVAMGMERTAVSRLAASCVSDGLVRRVASQADGRSITLRLTPRGRDVLANSRQQQRRAFEYITRDWDDDERLEFARLLHKYVAASSREASE